MNDRKQWIDFLKGIAIVSVIYYHTGVDNFFITLNVKVVVRKSEKFFYHSGCQILLRTWLECQWQAASLMRSIH